MVYRENRHLKNCITYANFKNIKNTILDFSTFMTQYHTLSTILIFQQFMMRTNFHFIHKWITFYTLASENHKRKTIWFSTFLKSSTESSEFFWTNANWDFKISKKMVIRYYNTLKTREPCGPWTRRSQLSLVFQIFVHQFHNLFDADSIGCTTVQKIIFAVQKTSRKHIFNIT